ncbi:MAG: polyhydroxyalkanoate synthesis regulator phasin [Thermoproteota archaeon]|jgi:polyhydroxyalkanoate synthesis regulator phasin
MKSLVSLLLLALITSCGMFDKSDSRFVASGGRGAIITEFFGAAWKNADNVAFKTASDADNALFKDFKSNPGKYGIFDADEVAKVKKMKNWDDLPSERYLSRIFQEASSILKLSDNAFSSALKNVKANASIVAQIEMRTVKVSSVGVKLNSKLSTKAGRRVDLQLFHLEDQLVATHKISRKQSKKVVADIQNTVKTLMKSVPKNDKAMKKSVQEMAENLMDMAKKTGKSIAGDKGCLKINTKESIANLGEIVHRLHGDVFDKGMKEWDELGLATRKHLGDVTNRTTRQADKAICAMTGMIGSCGPVLNKKLARNIACK